MAKKPLSSKFRGQKIILNFSLKGEEGENPISNKIGVVLDFHF